MTNTADGIYSSIDPSAPQVAVDRIAGEDFQRVKAGWGGEGAYHDVLDSDGERVPIGGAQLGAMTEAAPGTDTASSGLNGRLQRIAQNLTALVAPLGSLTEAAPGTDTASSGLNGRLQRIAQNITTQMARLGTTTEAAPGTDTAASGLNGRLQRIAQNLTALVAPIGGVTEAAPGTDTASSGLNGRLQRIAQNLTTVAGKLPQISGMLATGGNDTSFVASVPAAASISNAIDTNGYRNVGLIVPSTFDGAVISFVVSTDNVSYFNLYDILNNQVTMTIAANRAYDLPGELIQWRYWKILTGTVQAGTSTDFVVAGRS